MTTEPKRLAQTPDVLTAKAFLTMPRRYSYADYRALCALVKRNELVGSPLGRDGYITIRDVASAVGALLVAEGDACQALGLPVDPSVASIIVRR